MQYHELDYYGSSNRDRHAIPLRLSMRRYTPIGISVAVLFN